MQKYVQVAEKWLMNQRTFQFVPMEGRSDPCEIDVPGFYWNDDEYGSYVSTKYIHVGENADGKVYTTLNKTYYITLNQLQIELINGFKYGIISFLNEYGSEMKLTVEARPLTVGVSFTSQAVAKVVDVSYSVIGLSQPILYTSKLGSGFSYIPGLAQHRDGMERMKAEVPFHYGIAPKTYQVKYKNRKLGGDCLAMLCGPWAVLLDDERKFDSLAVLSGASVHELVVDKFLYTVNPYIVKVMMITK